MRPEIVKWYETNFDIEDRKRNENVQRASEDHLRQILDSIPAFVCALSPEGEVQFVNRQLLDYFGKTFEEMKSWATNDSIHPDDRAHSVAFFENSIKTGTPHELEQRCRRADGAYRWFRRRLRPVRDSIGKITGWYSLITDIEDQKRAEDALRANENNLRQILDSIPGIVGTLSASGDVELVNRQSSEYFGLTSEQLKSWEFRDVVHPEDMTRVLARFTHALATGTPFVDEHRYRRADGQYRWFHVCISPVRNTAGEISRWYTFSIDVHDRKRAEEELRRKKALLAEGQHLSSTGTFSWRLDTDEVVFSEQACRIFDFDLNANLTPGCIGGRIHPDDLPTLTEKMNQARTNVVDHDFEVRLCMANGTVKYMHARSHATRHQDGHLEYVQRIMHDGRRASEVITRLRALFSNKDPVAERVDLNEASREVIALCSDELQRNRVLLRQELANDLPCVTGDRVQLQQAILNLLRYASDAMSGVKDRPRELVIRTERSEGSYVQLTVQNTGVGIRLQGLERLFEAFYTTKSDGMGIGLSVSHSIIERHGGRLWAAPNGGPGATFSFSVPSRLNNAAMLSTAG